MYPPDIAREIDDADMAIIRGELNPVTPGVDERAYAKEQVEKGREGQVSTASKMEELVQQRIDSGVSETEARSEVEQAFAIQKQAMDDYIQHMQDIENGFSQDFGIDDSPSDSGPLYGEGL